MKSIKTLLILILLLTGCISQKVIVYTDKKEPEILSEPVEKFQDESGKTDNQPQDDYNIAGIWTFGDTTIKGYRFEFHRDGILILASPEITYSGEYSINYESNPLNLDMFIPEQGHIRTIIRFLDTDTIEMANTQEGMARPAAFEDSQILVRIEGI